MAVSAGYPLCKRGGNVTVGPTVKRLANQSNVWGKSIREREGWLGLIPFPSFSLRPRPLQKRGPWSSCELALHYCGPSPFWSGLGQVGSLQFGPPTNQQTHPTVLSHCQTATALILPLFCTLHLQQAVDISSLFHSHSHHSRERLPRRSASPMPHRIRAGARHSVTHSQSSTARPVPGSAPTPPACQPANSPFLCQTCQTRLMPPIDHPSPFR